MGTGPLPTSNRRKKPSEESKRRKKATRRPKSSKRRWHDSCSPSKSRSVNSSPSTFSSSDSEDDAVGASRDRSRKKEALVRLRHSPSRGGGSSRRQKKTKTTSSYQGEKDPRKHDWKSKLSDVNHHRKKGDDRRRRHSSSRNLDTCSSCSCSTCRSCSSSLERTKSAEKSLRSKGKVLKVSSGTRGGRSSSRREEGRSERRPPDGGYRHRSPSCSSCSRCGHEGRKRSRSRGPARGGGTEFRDDEQGSAEKSHSRNLLTSATLVIHSEEDMEYRYDSGKDGNGAAITQDFDDLLASRSNDNYDGDRKRDSRSGMAPPSPSQHAPERRRLDDSSRFMGRNGHGNNAEADFKREISSSVVATCTGSHDGAQCDDRNDSPTPIYAEPRLKSQVSTSGGGSEADELELLLRRKSLENFKKFRSRISTIENPVGEHKYESVSIKVHGVIAGKSDAAQLHERARPITLPVKLKAYTYLEHHTPASNGNQFLQFESISDANVSAQACNLVEKTERNNKKLMQRHLGDSANIKSVPDSFFSNSDPCSKEFQAESSREKFGDDLPSKNMLDKENSAKSGDTDVHRKEGNRLDVSASTDSSCYRSASEFEQKTMSVVHGGEVVKVSYKVYIPKKTPALARRQLQH